MLECISIAREGIADASQLFHDLAEVVVCDGVAWFQLNGPSQRTRCKSQLAALFVKGPEIVVEIRASGIQLDRLLDVSDRVDARACCVSDHAQKMPCIGAIRFTFYDPAAHDLGTVKSPILKMAKRAFNQIGGI